MTASNDWLVDILQCPLCGGRMEPTPIDTVGNQTIRCTTCPFVGRRIGRRFDLLPPILDTAAHAEDCYRREVLDRWAADLGERDATSIRQVQLFNILTSYWVTSQYFFLRDHFVPRYTLCGRGLEIGAGPAHQSGFISLYYPETQMVASDVAPVNMDLAEALAEQVGFRTEYFVTCDAGHLPFLDGSFDFIFSSAVLHHLADLPRAIREAWRVLRPGGMWYAMSEIAMGALPRWLWLSRLGDQGRIAHNLGIRETNYTHRQWVNFFEQNRFTLVESTFQRDPAHHLLSWSRALYYSVANRLPDWMFRAGVPSELGLVLRKREQ